jgi:hypothetical protein
MKKLVSMVSVVLGMVVLSLASCKDPNLWGGLLGTGANCSGDEVCFVEALFKLKDAFSTRDTASANEVIAKISDPTKKNFLEELSASIKAGGINKALTSLANTKKENFSLEGLGAACPQGTLSAKEIDTLIDSGESDKKTVGRICLANEAKTNTSSAGSLLTELKTATTSGTGGDDTVIGSEASAKSACREITKTQLGTANDTCAGLTETQLQAYLNAKL